MSDTYDPRGTEFCRYGDPPYSYLVCPECRSDDCGCESTTVHHRHRCFDCGYETVSAPRRLWE